MTGGREGGSTRGREGGSTRVREGRRDYEGAREGGTEKVRKGGSTQGRKYASEGGWEYVRGVPVRELEVAGGSLREVVRRAGVHEGGRF